MGCTAGFEAVGPRRQSVPAAMGMLWARHPATMSLDVPRDRLLQTANKSLTNPRTDTKFAAAPAQALR